MRQVSRKAVAIVVGALLSVMGAVLLVQWINHNRIMDPSDLLWEVSEGNHLIYEVEISGFNTTYVYHSENRSFSEYESELTFAQFNGTQVSAEIVNLPQLPSSINAESFFNNIVSFVKTQTTFRNGSVLPHAFDTILNGLISNCILPVGDWELIDLLYEDEVDYDSFIYGHPWRLSRLQDDSFYIGYRNFGPDYGSGWDGNVSLTAGTPRTAEYREYSAHPGWEDYGFVVRLSLVV